MQYVTHSFLPWAKTEAKFWKQVQRNAVCTEKIHGPNNGQANALSVWMALKNKLGFTTVYNEWRFYNVNIDFLKFTKILWWFPCGCTGQPLPIKTTCLTWSSYSRKSTDAGKVIAASRFDRLYRRNRPNCGNKNTGRDGPDPQGRLRYPAGTQWSDEKLSTRYERTGNTGPGNMFQRRWKFMDLVGRMKTSTTWKTQNKKHTNAADGCRAPVSPIYCFRNPYSLLMVEFSDEEKPSTSWITRTHGSGTNIKRMVQIIDATTLPTV